ncbi:MAG: CoA ester lyase [Pseudomonadota bacterium]
MRSALFIPGDSERKLAKGLGSGADVLLIDLEDSVALDDKSKARATTLAFLTDAKREKRRPALYVRVNAFDTELTEDDLAGVMSAAPEGIVLPKSEHGRDVTRLDAILRVFEAENNLNDGATRILAIATETAIGALQANTYGRASKRLMGLTWGAEDLSADIGALARRKADGSYRDPYRYARIQALLGAVAAGVQPIDTVYPDFRDLDGLKTECQEAALDGFTGKMAIHPAQVPVINAAFTPSAEAVDEAKRIVDAFEAADNPGVLALDGVMLDRPHLKKAQSLLARAASVDGET